MEEKHVVLIGTGFAGLQVINKLAYKKGIKVTAIDKNNHHLFQPLLYQVASSVLSPADIAIPTRSLTTSMRNIQVVMGEVLDVNLEHKKINLENTTITYDYLVFAMGARTSYFGNNHWKKFAPGLKNIGDALKIRKNILVSFEKAELERNPDKIKQLLTFVVVGGGPTGVEMAGSIAELSRKIIREDFRFIDPAKSKVILIEAGPRLLPSFSEKSSNITMKELEKRGVKVMVNTMVKDINEEGVHLDGEVINSQNIIWCAGVAASPLTQKLNIELDRASRIVVDEFCSIKEYPEVFAIGDVASFMDTKTKRPLPGVSPVAMQQGRYVADLIYREIKGKKREKSFNYIDKGSMATIGRKDAVAEMGNMKLSGTLGWLAWLFIHLFYQVGFKNKVSILITWIWSYISFKAGARLIQSESDSKEE
ncbi:MAG: NAD(P)/FAD-dependent oxidoreductase [Leptospiraceae bacterium]|nr:NAD(P)/FAD-dependent oxidoreductase [Leptospiraceae bacterium]